MSESAGDLSAWEAFYVIVGSSGGALIGLQFVVMTLIAERRSLAAGGAVQAFGTPTVVHLTGALVVSAFMSAPWTSLAALSIVAKAYGLGGLIYALIVGRRARRQTEYQPVWEDWLWYVIMPALAYAALVVAGFLLHVVAQPALFLIGTTSLGLLLIGIHNAWDSVTHVLIQPRDERPKPPVD